MPHRRTGLRGHEPAVITFCRGLAAPRRFAGIDGRGRGNRRRAGVIRRIFMRKLLLASAAILGASGGLALAQTPANPSQGQLAAPYGAGPAKDNNNNAWGVANTPSGSVAAGPLSTIYAPNVIAVPAPGTIVIRLNGRVETDITATFSSLNTGVGIPASNAFSANPSGRGYKLNPIGVGSYIRL